MLSCFALNRMDIFALVAVGITTFLFLGSALHAANLYASVKPMSAVDMIIGLSGWIIATFGPVGLAVAFWRLAKATRRAWLIHLLMLPLALALLWIGSILMLFVTGTPDFDDTIGGPIIQGLALFLLSVNGYYSAVLYAMLKARLATANFR